MNYFLNAHATPIYLIYIIIGAVFLAWFGIRLTDHIQSKSLNERTEKWIIGICFFACLFFIIATLSLFSYLFNDGKIRKLYLIDQDSQPRLVVWLVWGKSHRIKTYDLKTGEETGYLKIYGGPPFSGNFEFYEPPKRLAWGYSDNRGLCLVDLAEATLIANEEDIIQHNPQLKNGFYMYAGDYTYNPFTQTVLVIAKNGNLYRIDTNLNATPTPGIMKRPWSPPKVRWNFHYVPGTNKKVLKRTPPGQTSLSAKKDPLISPEIVKELGKKYNEGDKVWVTHYNSIFRNANGLISYMNSNGKKLNTIKLKDIFDSEETRALATLTLDDEVLVFVSAGGYNLTALRTDPGTGEVKGQINYLE